MCSSDLAESMDVGPAVLSCSAINLDIEKGPSPAGDAPRGETSASGSRAPLPEPRKGRIGPRSDEGSHVTRFASAPPFSNTSHNRPGPDIPEPGAPPWVPPPGFSLLLGASCRMLTGRG